MAETVYTTTTVLEPDRLIVVSMLGGSLTIEAKHGASWATVETLADGDVKTVEARGRQYRFTPSAGSFAVS